MIIVLFVSWWLEIFCVTIFNPSGLCLLKGNKVPCPCIFCDHTTGVHCPKSTCCMKSQSYEKLWPPLNFRNGWLTSNCCSGSCKTFNSGFQFQFQFQGFQFQFHFQFHQFQVQFQFRNWNWNWAAIPIPELNWPQPWWQYMYSITKCKQIWLYTWDIGKIKKYGIRPFCPDPGAKRHTPCHFAPNGMFHCINVVQAVLWLIITWLCGFWREITSVLP